MHGGMTEIGAHHVGKAGICFPLAVHHYTQQAAPSLLLVTIEHLKGKEVVS